MSEFRPEFTGKQSEAWLAIHRKEIDELLFGGAKGGAKSVFGCYWSYLETYEIARQFIPDPLSSPIPVTFMGRKIAKHFKESTLDTWKRFVPEDRYEIKGDPPVIIIGSRVMIRTGGLDTREDIQKFNSAEFGRIFIDQAEETTRDDVAALRGSMRLIINGHKVIGKTLFTANPAQCWLKEEFITNPAPNRAFIQALPSDNPYLGQDYIDRLKEAFKHRPELLQAYLYGDWNVLEGAEQIIKSEWLRAAKSRSAEFWPEIRRFLVCDTARYGDDETVILQMYNSEIEEKAILPYCPTTQISGRLASMSRQNDNIPVVVESIGADLGAGVIDELTELEVDVIAFNPAAKSSNPEVYYNKRAEAWSNAAKIMSSGILDPANNCAFVLENSYMELENQLCVPQYKFRTGRILIESKEDIKKRLGRSPDHADAYVIGLWAYGMVEPVAEEKTRYRDRKSKKPESAMVC